MILAWRAFGTVCAAILYAIAVSGAVYQYTTPVAMPMHELLRKIYAVGAFALLGFVLERSRLRRLHGVVAAGIALAVYSCAIELGQRLIAQSTETIGSNAFDAASGLVGGALGAFVSLLLSEPQGRARRLEAIGIGIGLALLAGAFGVTFGSLD